MSYTPEQKDEAAAEMRAFAKLAEDRRARLMSTARDFQNCGAFAASGIALMVLSMTDVELNLIAKALQ